MSNVVHQTDIIQVGAAGKSIVSNFSDCFGKGNGFQLGALGKSVVANGAKRLGKGDILKPGAAAECTGTQNLDRILQRYSGQIRITAESGFAYITADPKGCQTGAAVEDTAAQFLDRAAQNGISKRSTAREGIVAHLGDVIRQTDIIQLCAAGKGIISNLNQTFSETNLN